MQKKFQDRVRSCDVCLVNDGWNHEYGIKIRVRDNLRNIKNYDLDHFIPRSYTANDELWNLTPVEKQLQGYGMWKCPMYVSRQ